MTQVRALWAAPMDGMGPYPGTPGYHLPDLAKAECHALTHGLSMGNLEVRAPTGARNWLVCPPGYNPPHRLLLTFHAQGHDNILLIGSGAQVYGSFNFYGSGNMVVFGGEARQPSRFDAGFFSRGHLLFAGKGVTSNGVTFALQGDRTRIIIGDDCMFAHNITLRTCDQHAIIDMDSGDCINPAADVHLEPHVWVTQDALVLKGARIGFGSIIGARSVVNRAVPRYALAAGAPAKPLRQNVSWDRRDKPREGLAAMLREFEARLQPW